MAGENIVCIFAHPDDEAFGPSGIIAKWSKDNNVCIICVTDGSNPNSGQKELSKIRKDELIRSAAILGVKHVRFLDYIDGELKNNIYHKVAGDIENILLSLKPSKLLTFENKGVSGHIDHVFVSLVSCFLYEKLEFIRKIYFWCLPKVFSDNMKGYFVYCPRGYKREEVDHVEDVADVWDKKLLAISAHSSQNEDGTFVLNMLEKSPKEELFFVKEKQA